MTDAQFDQIITDYFNAISVLLVFITALFSVRYAEIQKLLNEDLPFGKPAKLDKQRKKLLSCLYFKWVPVVLLIAICTYLMSPTAISIISVSTVDLIHFSFIRTAFFLVWMLSLLFLIASIYISIEIIRQSNKCK